MRLFLAIELPPGLREHLVAVRDAMKGGFGKVSMTRDENLHITVKFLGEVEPDRLDALKESLGLIRAGGTIETFAEKVECFPDKGPIRIVAAGFGGDVTGLKALYRSIEQRCQHLGFDRETREYRPHVTLARARPTLPGSVRTIAAEAVRSSLPGPAFVVGEFTLIQSHLSQQGSRYETIARFPITGQA